MDNEEKTYQPRWEEKKAEQEQHHHHHHHYYEHSYNHSSRRSGGVAGWLKDKDKQAWRGFMLLVIAAVVYGGIVVGGMVKDALDMNPEGDEAAADRVDVLGIDKVVDSEKRLLGDSLKTELQMDSLVRTVTGEHHNVYRPPKKNKNDLIDGREWNSIIKNLRRWFKANGGDPKLIIALVLFGLGILGLAGYGIYKHKHKHGNYRW